MALTPTTTSHVLKGLNPNVPNVRFGTMGRITAVSKRNFANVRISSPGTRLARLSSAVFNSSNTKPSTVSVVAAQYCSRETSAPIT